MAGIVDRIKAFIRSPKAQQMIKDRRNQQKAKELWARRGRP